VTDKQRIFIAEYLINGFNATQAAITAGYSEKTAKSIGNENLTKPDIRKEVQNYVNSALNAKKDVLKKQIVDKFASVAFSTDPDVREADKLKANEMLGRYMTMFTDKVDYSGTLKIKTEDMSKLTDAELAEIASKS